MPELFSSTVDPQLPELTSIEVTLLNCLQRLEVLEQCVGVLVQAAQAQVNGYQDHQQLTQTLSDQLAVTQQMVESLGDRLPRPSQMPMPDLQPLTHQLSQLQGTVQTQALVGKVLGGVAIAGFAALALSAGLFLYPAHTSTQNALTRQQKLLSHLLVCTLKPDTRRCTQLRQAIATQEAAQ